MRAVSGQENAMTQTCNASPTPRGRAFTLFLLPLAAAISSCGGGGADTAAPVVEPFTDEQATVSSLADTRRAAAARAAANSSSNACAPIGAFYWEIGGPLAKLASGRVGLRYASTTVMDIASSTKLLSAAYLIEKAAPTAAEVPFLNFTSGYVDFKSFTSCNQAVTVAECAAAGTNADFTPAAVGRFSYGGGHLQQLALKRGMGSWTNETLAGEFSRVLGMEVQFINPQLGGGARTSADEYARFMRRVMTGQLQMGAWLGRSAVCTEPGRCSTALYSPSLKPLNYSLGHWVESDADGAYSSPGAFGFYPWISQDRSLYGIVAKQALPGDGESSLDCGRAIRAAWLAAG
jgi:hypothetical protein